MLLCAKHTMELVTRRPAVKALCRGQVVCLDVCLGPCRPHRNTGTAGSDRTVTRPVLRTPMEN